MALKYTATNTNQQTSKFYFSYSLYNFKLAVTSTCILLDTQNTCVNLILQSAYARAKRNAPTSAHARPWDYIRARYTRARIQMNVDPKRTPKIQIAIADLDLRLCCVLRLKTQRQCIVTFIAH